MQPLPISDIVFVAGACMFASVIERRFFVLPILLALLFPGYIMQAAFIGMVSSILFGAMLKLSQGAR